MPENGSRWTATTANQSGSNSWFEFSAVEPRISPALAAQFRARELSPVPRPRQLALVRRVLSGLIQIGLNVGKSIAPCLEPKGLALGAPVDRQYLRQARKRPRGGMLPGKDCLDDTRRKESQRQNAPDIRGRHTEPPGDF